MPRRRTGETLEARTRTAILAHAFFRWESALTIALTILLVFLYPKPFAWWQWWYWLILGFVGEILIVVSSLTDLRTGQKVVTDMLRQEFNPRDIRYEPARQRLQEALDYRERIARAIESSDAGVLRDHLSDTTGGISDWIAGIYRLAKRLDGYYNDPVIKRDMGSLPKAIKTLAARARLEEDESVREQIQTALKGKRQQLENLQRLENLMEKAEYQLETTTTALGTVYSQLQLIQAKEVDGVRGRLIAERIRDQVNGLQDILTTMDELYGRSQVGSST